MEIPITLFFGFVGAFFAFFILGLVTKKPIMSIITGILLLSLTVSITSMTMNSFLNGEGGIVTSYEVTSRTGQDDVRTANSAIYAEFVSSSSSMLLGDTVNCLTLHIKKSGAPDANTLVRYGVWDNSATPVLKYTFGTMNITAVPTTVQPIKHCNLASSYTIVNFDRIGIAWDDGDAANRVTIDLDTTNPFDGTTTFIARWSGASWVSATGTDYQGKLSLEQVSEPIVYDNYEFTEFPKTIFALFSVLLMLVGIIMWRSEQTGDYPFDY